MGPHREAVPSPPPSSSANNVITPGCVLYCHACVPGTITFPLPKPQAECGGENIGELAKHAGCNLFTHVPEIKNWVCEQCPGKQLTIGGYAYLDGALHVQVNSDVSGRVGGGALLGGGGFKGLEDKTSP
jgi:hypothetical protein